MGSLFGLVTLAKTGLMIFSRKVSKAAVGNGDHHFAAHDGTLEVGIGIILIPVVGILRIGFFRRQLLQKADHRKEQKLSNLPTSDLFEKRV